MSTHSLSYTVSIYPFFPASPVSKPRDSLLFSPSAIIKQHRVSFINGWFYLWDLLFIFITTATVQLPIDSFNRLTHRQSYRKSK